MSATTVSEKPTLFRIFENGKPTIVSALEANIEGLRIAGGQANIPVSDKLFSRYLDLIKSPEYAQAVSEPQYSEVLEQLKEEGQRILDAYNRCIFGLADTHIRFARGERMD